MAELTGDWAPSTGRELAEAAAPEAMAVLRGICEHTPVDAATTAAVRRACADVFGLDPLPSAAGDGFERADIVAFARRFATDVSAIDDGARASFTHAAGAETFATIQAIYVADMAPRVLSVLDALAGQSSSWALAGPDFVDAPTAWAAIEDFLRIVHRLDALDPVLEEVVRLRGARQHDCRLCRSIRSRPALVSGATETTFDAIDEPGWPSFDERTRAALALTDAIIWTPADLADQLVAEVRHHLTRAQATEVVLDVMRNAANKIAVALAADAPNVAEGIEVYEIDDDGVAHYGLAAPA